jgi:hypothetical protein
VRRRTEAVRRERAFRRHAPGKFVFVVTPGRSGSTLVQGLLNALPNTLIRGENNFYLLPMFRAQSRVVSYQHRFSKDTHRVRSAHYGIANFDIPGYADMARQWTLRALLGDVDPRAVDVIGFKEVRWNEIMPSEEEAFFAWLETLFPDARYVLNRRDPESVIRSGHYREISEEMAAAIVRRVFDIQAYLRRTRPGRTFDTDFEIIAGADDKARDATLHDLAEFVVGSCPDELLTELRNVTTVPHGPYPFGASRGHQKIK